MINYVHRRQRQKTQKYQTLEFFCIIAEIPCLFNLNFLTWKAKEGAFTQVFMTHDHNLGVTAKVIAYVSTVGRLFLVCL